MGSMKYGLQFLLDVIMKMHILVKRVWNDFDIPIEMPMLISENKSLLEQEAIDRNVRRSKDEISKEIEYSVTSSINYIGALK
jgi:hypothetical protein